jgi:cysteine-rich repeat protein
VNDGSYGSCMPDCTRGPRCGDGERQEEHEACDDGINLTVYSSTGEPGCAPGCKEGAWCGDGVLNGLFGEECDDGTNEGGYGKCTPECRLDARCGDSVVQTEYGEECDDGNSIADDECTLDCKEQLVHVE